MALEFDVLLGPDRHLTLPLQIATALDVEPGQHVRFLLHKDGSVEVAGQPAQVSELIDPQWLLDLQLATQLGEGEQVVALLEQAVPDGALLWVALGLLVALEQELPAAAQLAAGAAAQLEQRGWRGDGELAELLRDRAAGQDRGRPAVPAALEELAEILDQDAYSGLSGRLNLDSGEVVPGAILEMDPDFADEVEDGAWLSVPAEGSRAPWQAMALFAELQEPRLRRRLLAAIEGRGAFRRFREVIHDEPEPLVQSWYQFSAERAAGRAVEWLAGMGYDVAPRVGNW